MMVSATIGHKKVTISEHASLVLSALRELEKAGLIEDGSANIYVEPGCDPGTLVGQAGAVVTRRGQQFVEQLT